YLTIINSKWTNRSRARSKLRMHAIVAAQIAAALCLIQVVNADLPGDREPITRRFAPLAFQLYFLALCSPKTNPPCPSSDRLAVPARHAPSSLVFYSIFGV